MNEIAHFHPGLTWREKLALIVHRFKPVEDTPTPVEHLFTPGWYVREMRIPAGTLFIGRAHRHGHRCELVEGTVRLHLEDGTHRDLSAPFDLHTEPGFHTVLRALTYVVGRTYHPNPTESRNIDELEADAFHSVEEMLALGAEVEQKCIGVQ